MEEALAQARKGALFIMDKMLRGDPEPREELSPYAPRMYRIKINPDKIRDIIGPGGKMIRKIPEETEDHDRHPGRRHGQHRLQQRREHPEGDRDDRGLTKDVEAGEIYTGKVTRADALRRLRRDPARQGRPGPHLGAGQLPRAERRGRGQDRRRSQVLVTEIDRQGRINLSRRAVLAGEEPPAAPAGGGDNGGSRSGPPRPRRPGSARRWRWASGGGQREGGFGNRGGGGGGGGGQREGGSFGGQRRGGGGGFGGGERGGGGGGFGGGQRGGGGGGFGGGQRSGGGTPRWRKPRLDTTLENRRMPVARPLLLRLLDAALAGSAATRATSSQPDSNSSLNTGHPKGCPVLV